MLKFKKMASVHYSERKQGLMHYYCKNFITAFNNEEQKRFIELCEKCSCGHTDALFEFLIHDVGVSYITEKYGVSRSRLYYYKSEFYNNFEYIKRI